MDIRKMLTGESNNVEFKERRPGNSDRYMKTAVAFANGKGGSILFGVNDDRKVVGIPDDILFREMDAIANAISDSCEPTIIPDIYPQTIDGKTVIVVEISPGRQKPYYIKSEGIAQGVYIRVAGTSRRADRAVALKNCKNETQKHSVRDVTKNVLLSWVQKSKGYIGLINMSFRRTASGS